MSVTGHASIKEWYKVEEIFCVKSAVMRPTALWQEIACSYLDAEIGNEKWARIFP